MSRRHLHTPTLSEVVETLYERIIDFGAHPNERAVSGSGKIINGEERKELMQIHMHGDGLALEHALKTTAQCGLGSLLILREIFPERFALLNIGKDIDRLRGACNDNTTASDSAGGWQTLPAL